MRRSVFVILIALCLPLLAHAKTTTTGVVRYISPPSGATDNPANIEKNARLSAPAASDTTWLYSQNFDSGGCSAGGWTSVDLTAEDDDYWHVDDYAGLSFGPLDGSQSLWCGTRAGSDYTLCQYATLPGYGNGWDQKWCTKQCLAVSGGATSDLDVSFHLRYDSEPSYDYTALEYTTDCAGEYGWTEIDGGYNTWTWIGDINVNSSYAVGAGPVKVRLRFFSDSGYSDQDGLFQSDGGAHVDNLKVEDLSIEDFEDETPGATSTQDWESCNQGYGDYAGLFSGSTLLQEDPCTMSASCMWAFIQGSTYDYSCGGHPEQLAVPYGNARGEYILNEIWSPLIPVSGSGSTFLKFDVYRDLAPDNFVGYTYRARSFIGGCPTPWKFTGLLFDGDGKDWYQHVQDITGNLDLVGATHIQVAIGVRDLCYAFCGVFPSPCHSHAPLLDNVSVFRVENHGPQWNVRPIDLFQDNFSEDGTSTGTARADAAIDIKPTTSNSITPGDSSIILYLVDPAYASGITTDTSGLLPDVSNPSTYPDGRPTHNIKRQAYIYVAVWPLDNTDDPGDKVGADLAEGGGTSSDRYFFAGTQLVDGVLWTKIRLDYTYSGSATNPGTGFNDAIIASRFNVDLNDNIFEPGDTVCYFFGATSAGGTTYYSDNWHITNNISEVVANPMEFTILPAGGTLRGGDVLYVDGADGLGVQPYYDGVFKLLSIDDKVDRYDVRSPSSGDANTLAGRVKDIQQQINDNYQLIIWDCGDLPVTLGDGPGGGMQKADDYALLNTYLNNLTNPGGVFLAGDDVAENLSAAATASAGTFKSVYMPFTLLSGDHIAHGLGISPTVYYWPGRSFYDDFVVFGGCPAMNDFDVMAASGTSRIEMSYGATQGPNGAVLFNINGTARVMLAGFSTAFVRDNELDGLFDRAVYLRQALAVTAASSWPSPTSAGPAISDRLDQNYPNPFNPSTTIAFSIRSRSHVDLAVYDVAGRLVRTLANETRPAGAFSVEWDGRDSHGSPVASGVYFYRLVAGDFTHTRKMVLLK